MIRLRLFILLLFFVFSFNLKSQDIKVISEFDTTRILIGDQIFYTVIVEQPSDIVLTLKPLKDTLCKNVEIISGPLYDTVQLSDGKIKLTNKYLITSFDSGFYEIPPVYAELSEDRNIKRFYSDYSFLEVMRARIAPQDTSQKIFDIVGPYRAPVTIGEIVPWVFLGLALAAVVTGIIYLIRKLKRKKEPIEEIKPSEPAHIIAFRELEKLRSEELWQRGELKAYYSRLTEILREYLENRYGIYSLEMTTSETLDSLLFKGFRKDDVYTLLKEILTGADLVKFAKSKPDPSENVKFFNDAWSFIDKTRIKDEEQTYETNKAENN